MTQIYLISCYTERRNIKISYLKKIETCNVKIGYDGVKTQWIWNLQNGLNISIIFFYYKPLSHLYQPIIYVDTSQSWNN